MTDLIENKDGTVKTIANSTPNERAEIPQQLDNSTVNIQPGDVIYVGRGFYKHYGVYAGNDKVIHFAPLTGKEINAENAVVHETNLDYFLKGGELKIDRKSKAEFSRLEIVERARSQIGSKSYNLVFFNCEHFARWCKTGVYESAQVDSAIDLAAEGVIYIKDLISGKENPEGRKKLISKLTDYLS